MEDTVEGRNKMLALALKPFAQRAVEDRLTELRVAFTWRIEWQQKNAPKYFEMEKIPLEELQHLGLKRIIDYFAPVLEAQTKLTFLLHDCNWNEPSSSEIRSSIKFEESRLTAMKSLENRLQHCNWQLENFLRTTYRYELHYGQWRHVRVYHCSREDLKRTFAVNDALDELIAKL